ncbi:MAG: hypothetical protein ACLR60_03135 [Clostridium paraputrificum]
MSNKEIHIDLQELETQLNTLNSSIEKLRPYTNSFVSETMNIFETFNSDFIDKMNDVIKRLSSDTAKNILEKAEKIHSETKIIYDEFKEADEKISNSIGG